MWFENSSVELFSQAIYILSIKHSFSYFPLCTVAINLPAYFALDENLIKNWRFWTQLLQITSITNSWIFRTFTFFFCHYFFWLFFSSSSLFLSLIVQHFHVFPLQHGSSLFRIRLISLFPITIRQLDRINYTKMEGYRRKPSRYSRSNKKITLFPKLRGLCSSHFI